MATATSLLERIDAEFAAADERSKASKVTADRSNFKDVKSGWKNVASFWNNCVISGDRGLKHWQKNLASASTCIPPSNRVGGVPILHLNRNWPESTCVFRLPPIQRCRTVVFSYDLDHHSHSNEIRLARRNRVSTGCNR